MDETMRILELRELDFTERAAYALALLGVSVIEGEIDGSPAFVTTTIKGELVAVSTDVALQEDEAAWEDYCNRSVAPPWCVNDWQDLIKLLFSGQI